jgi:tetratricopeptide (TPR) repeat protein
LHLKLLIPNSSIVSIILGSLLSFILPLTISVYKKYKFKLVLFVGILLLLFLAFILINSNGRAGWAGLIVALGFIFFKSLKPYLFGWFSIIIFIGLGIFLYMYKVDSSSGRLLVYKVSIKIISNNLTTGIGFGKFKAKYNEYQASYFATNDINSKEALLADNTFYAYNDFYQILIEFGLIGFSISLILLWGLYQLVNKLLKQYPQNVLIKSSVASIISILVASLFSYPFQILLIIIQFIFCISILLYFYIKGLSKFKNTLVFLMGFCILIFLSFSFFNTQYKLKAIGTQELSRAGYKTDALNNYKVLSKSYFAEGNYLFEYARELYNCNKVNEAIIILNATKNSFISSEVYKFSASINTELKNYTQAEKDYKTAIFMVPNRMTSRKNLLDFYIEQKDTTNAIFWAKSIISMPVKIESNITKSIQKTTEIILKNLEKR